MKGLNGEKDWVKEATDSRECAPADSTGVGWCWMLLECNSTGWSKWVGDSGQSCKRNKINLLSLLKSRLHRIFVVQTRCNFCRAEVAVSCDFIGILVQFISAKCQCTFISWTKAVHLLESEPVTQIHHVSWVVFQTAVINCSKIALKLQLVYTQFWSCNFSVTKLHWIAQQKSPA